MDIEADTMNISRGRALIDSWVLKLRQPEIACSSWCLGPIFAASKVSVLGAILGQLARYGRARILLSITAHSAQKAYRSYPDSSCSMQSFFSAI